MANSNYCVTFRIADKTANGRTYAQRRDLLIENVREGKGYWEETTSFLLVESALSTSDFGQTACRGLSEADDLVVVFDPSDMSAVYFGSLAHEAILKSFFPRLKKLP